MTNIYDEIQKLTSEDIIRIVTDLGSDSYIETENEIRFKTICHNEDCASASMKLYYYKKDKRFHCYTECGCSYNLIQLFEKRYKLLHYDYNFYNDIALKISGEIGRGIRPLVFPTKYESDFEKYNHTPPRVQHPILDPSILNTFSSYHAVEWLTDGINDEMMWRYGIKYSIGENKIIIPHYDEKGHLIGVRGRTLNKDEEELYKYMPITFEGKILKHQLGFNLYGLNMVGGNIRKKKMAIVAEGEKAALQYGTMFGHEHNICVAACGSSISSYQIDLLIKHGAERILIAFDKEGETYEEKQKYFKKLQVYCERYRIKVKMGFIWDNQNLLSLKESPFDRGKNTFLKLYKNAIWI